MPGAAAPRYRHHALTWVASIRSRVSASVVYSSRGKPQNSELVVFSTTRFSRPDTTLTPAPASFTTRVTRVISPVRANECRVSPMGAQPYSSTATRARVICGWVPTK